MSRALVVPSSALRGSGNSSSVLIQSHGRAVSRRVTVGITSGGLTQILTGLHLGERVRVDAPGGLSSSSGGALPGTSRQKNGPPGLVAP